MVGRELGEKFPGGVGCTEDVVLEVQSITNQKIKDESLSFGCTKP